MDILNISGSIIFTSAFTILRDVIVDAVSKKANLRKANLLCADLYGADLRSADLRSADLRGADLRCANLYGANLRDANLRDANLRSADLRGADLRCANLYGANLYGADLYGANLRDANLRDAKNAELAIAQVQFIPTEGSFVGWKKCQDEIIVKLWIAKTAKRSHGYGRKCRADRVKVAEVFGAKFGVSLYDSTVIYRKGEELTPKNGWGENRWEDCAPGIHFFITREEAEAYR